MPYKRLTISIVFLRSLGLLGLQAQEIMNASGGNVSGSGGSVSYSFEQLVYKPT